MFSLGDTVWTASVQNETERIQCPDCFGKKFLTVILGDGSQVTVSCSECEAGYLGSQGTVRSYVYRPAATPAVVSGIHIANDDEGDYIRYDLNSAYGHEARDVFATKEEAEARAAILYQRHLDREAIRLFSKEKPNKSWSWNVSYHRGCIRRDEKDLAYHRGQLEMSLKHVKEEKELKNDGV